MRFCNPSQPFNICFLQVILFQNSTNFQSPVVLFINWLIKVGIKWFLLFQMLSLEYIHEFLENHQDMGRVGSYTHLWRSDFLKNVYEVTNHILLIPCLSNLFEDALQDFYRFVKLIAECVTFFSRLWFNQKLGHLSFFFLLNLHPATTFRLGMSVVGEITRDRTSNQIILSRKVQYSLCNIDDSIFVSNTNLLYWFGLMG